MFVFYLPILTFNHSSNCSFHWLILELYSPVKKHFYFDTVSTWAIKNNYIPQIRSIYSRSDIDDIDGNFPTAAVNKLHVLWPKAKKIYLLMFLEIRNLKWVSEGLNQSVTKAEFIGANLFACLFQNLEIVHIALLLVLVSNHITLTTAFVIIFLSDYDYSAPLLHKDPCDYSVYNQIVQNNLFVLKSFHLVTYAKFLCHVTFAIVTDSRD